jgi:mannose-6-phosphate isomerase-like protein (cupin superfamily)
MSMNNLMKCFTVLRVNLTEFDDGITHVFEGDCIIIPKGVLHRPICKGRVKCLLIEIDGTLTKENTDGTYSK